MGIIEKAKADYQEFCKLFNGVPFSDVDKLVKQYNLSYGAFNPNNNNDMRDINYKNICATTLNTDGKSVVNRGIELYDNNGVFLKYFII